MHPFPTELRQFANSESDSAAEQEAVRHHLETCAECREYVRLVVEWNRELSDDIPLTADFMAVAEQVYTEALSAMRPFRKRTIDLIPMTVSVDPLPVRLAADSETGQPSVPGLEHAATLYSADPELVLRIMRDRQTGEESLHLIGTDPALTSNVLIHIIEPTLNFLTDAQGVARLGTKHIEKPETLRWQIRLPEAVFGLSPLEYSPERPGAKREFELEADSQNRIRVELENRTEGIMLHLTLLRIGGSETLQRARLVITQGASASQTVETKGPAPCTITGLSATEPIGIRVFAD